MHLLKDISMIEINSQQALMVWLINYIADNFGNKAILKGGMELRLLDCPRYTNDIDYIFVPFSSKKDIAVLILNCLKKNPELSVNHSLNSKCLRCICQYNEFRVQLEITVSRECETQELSTVSFARKHNQTGRIIRGMRFDISLAHKIAAWNERALMRDLYDCYFMSEILDIYPDVETLKQRLANSLIRVGKKTKKQNLSLREFVLKLQLAVSHLNQEDLEEELRDFFSPEELPGLDMKMKIGLKKQIDYLTKQK